MFNTSKLMKKDGQKVTELEEEIAKSLQHFEQSKEQAASLAHLRLVYINSASQVEFTNTVGVQERYMMVRIPFRSLLSFRKVSSCLAAFAGSKSARQPASASAARLSRASAASRAPMA